MPHTLASAILLAPCSSNAWAAHSLSQATAEARKGSKSARTHLQCRDGCRGETAVKCALDRIDVHEQRNLTQGHEDRARLETRWRAPADPAKNSALESGEPWYRKC